MKKEELYSDHWLLAYEAYVKGWLPSADGSDYVGNDPFFKIMIYIGVDFYYSKGNVLEFIKEINTNITNY